MHHFDEDFVTVNPYLGSDGVNPFLDVCKEEKKESLSLLRLPIHPAENSRIRRSMGVRCMNWSERKWLHGDQKSWVMSTVM